MLIPVNPIPDSKGVTSDLLDVTIMNLHKQ